MKRLWRKLFPVKIIHVAQSDYHSGASMVNLNGELIILTRYGTIYRYYTSLNQGYPVVERIFRIDLET